MAAAVPLNYLPSPDARRRPRRILVCAILAIVFGVIGTIANPVSSIGVLAMKRYVPASPGSPAIQGLHRATLIEIISESFVSTLLSILLLVAGVMLIKDRPSARKLMIGYAIPAIVVSILGFVMSEVNGQELLAGMNVPAQSDLMLLISNLFGFAFSLSVPVAMLWIVQTRRAKVYLNSLPFSPA